MPILNYTTSVAAEKTTTEIQQILAKAKAKAIVTEYDDEGVLSSMSFQVIFNDMPMHFRLPARIDKIFIILQNDPNVPRKLKTRAQASRVTWRIIKDWIQSQMALIEAEQAELAEVFLPYAEMSPGVTVYQRLEQNGFQELLTYTHSGEGE